MGKKCCVPHCYTGYRKYKEKFPMYGVPKDDFFLNKWQEAVARADRPITPNDCVCQKHFQPEDFIKSRIVKGEIEEYKVPKLRPDAVPSVFPEIPESIHGMVKKRRKMSVDEELHKSQTERKEQKEGEKEKQATENEIVMTEIKKEQEDLLENGAKESGNCDNNSSRSCAMEICETVLKEEINIKTEDVEEEEQLLEEATGPRIFKCEHCDYQSKWLNNVQTHQTKHLEGEEYYFRCEKCPTFKTKWHNTYNNHMKLKHGLGPQEIFKCHLCKYETKIKICLKRHVERHNRGVFDEKFQCNKEHCNFKSNSKALFDFHIQNHDQSVMKNKRYNCTECLFETDSRNSLTKHVKSVHNNGDDAALDLSVKKVEKSSTEAMKFKCTRCNYHTNSHTALLKHIFQHNYDEMAKANIFRCLYCPYATFIQSALEDHHRWHFISSETQITHFKCEDCNLEFNKKHEYINHTLTHRNISVEKVTADSGTEETRTSNVSDHFLSGYTNL